MEDPGQHRSRRRLAVSPRNNEHFFTAQKLIVEEVRHGGIRRGIRARHPVTALFEHAGKRGHGRAADPDEVNLFLLCHDLKVADETAAGAVAASRNFTLTASPLTCKSAFTPIGRVMFLRETCPERKPKATGTPRLPTTRRMTSWRVYPWSLCWVQSTISPKMIPRTSANFPASFNCISIR